MPLQQPTSKLNELDHLILWCMTPGYMEGNCTDISSIRSSLELLLTKHNFIFKRTKERVPRWTYFYQRLEKLIAWEYVNKVGSKGYRINYENREKILEYLKGYVNINYGRQNGDV